MNISGNIRVFTNRGGGVLLGIKYMTWDQRKCSLFTVDKSCYFSNSKSTWTKMGTGKSVHYKEVFTNQGCSL